MTNQEAREILVGLEAAYRDLDPLAFTDDGIQLLNERIEAVMAAISALEKQDVPDKNVGDTISRQAAIDCFWTKERYFRDALDVIKDIRQLPSAQPEQRWIPFVLRPATDEEKEENPGLDYYLDGKLPKDGQKILITVRLPGHEEVQADEFYTDADCSYLDGQYEIGTEAVAWMSMPAPYEGVATNER